jgi:hypothetical protein
MDVINIKKFHKNCPECNKIQEYSCRSSLNLANRKNTKCYSCISKKRIPWNLGKKGSQVAWNKGLTKETDERVKRYGLSQRGKTISYDQRKKMSEKMKGKIPWNKNKKGVYSKESLDKMSKNSNRYWKGKHLPEYIKNKIIKKNTGRHHSYETKIKLSNLNKGKKLSESTKQKIRQFSIERIKKQGIVAAYNPKACNFIDVLNDVYGWNLQHAMNGGEKIIYGYYLDGYDEKRNIIFEYDEPHHYDVNGNLKLKDQKRQENLIKHLNPLMFIRYNDMYKNLNIVDK